MLLAAVGVRSSRRLQRYLRKRRLAIAGNDARRGWQRQHGFTARVGVCLAGLAVLYAIYAVGAYWTLGPSSPFAYRAVMILGMATFPLPLLVGPAVFTASLDHFDLYGAMGPRVRRRHWQFLALIALGTYLVCAIGPIVFDRALEAVAARPMATPRQGLVAEGHARVVGPIAIGLFVLVSGVSGAVAGHATMGFGPFGRVVARWAAGVIVTGAFCATLVGVDELITMHGVLTPTWLALGPPLVPLFLTSLVARQDCMRIADSVFSRLGVGRRNMDSRELDALVSTVVEADDTDAAAAGGVKHGPEAEIATLLSGLRRAGVDRIILDPERARRLVADTPAGTFAPTKSVGTSGIRQTVRWVPATATFVVAWSVLSGGLLLLGGSAIATPSVVSAVLAGFVGAGTTVFLSRPEFERPTTATLAT